MAAVAEAGGDMKSALPTVAQVLVNSRDAGTSNRVWRQRLCAERTDADFPHGPDRLTIPSRDGVDLKARCWSVPSPRGILVVAHGLGEHGALTLTLPEPSVRCSTSRSSRSIFEGMAAARVGAARSAVMKTSSVTCGRSSPGPDNGTPICLCSCWAIPMEVRLFSAWPWGKRAGFRYHRVESDDPDRNASATCKA